MPKGQSKFFPGKLRVMLDKVESLGLSHGSSWVSEGRAFAIHNPDVFMEEISPQFFDKQTHLRSFHRQLSIWGFTRLETGAGGRGVWFHSHFLQDKPELIKHIKRVPVKNPKPSTSTTLKNQPPDYTNYHLPVSADQGSPYTTNGPHTKPLPVHLPHHNVAAAGAGLPSDSNILPASSMVPMPPHPSSLDYLSTIGRMYPAVPHMYPATYNTTSQMPVSSSVYSSFVPTNYQPSASAVTSMGHLPGISNTNGAGLSELAQQLLACRNIPSSTNLLGDMNSNSNLNTALLAMIMDSRRRDTPASNSGTGTADLSQELLSAVARRNIFPQGPDRQETHEGSCEEQTFQGLGSSP